MPWLRKLQSTSYLVSISQWWKDKDHPHAIATVKAQYKQLLPSAKGSQRLDAQSSEAEVGESLATNKIQHQSTINGALSQSTLQNALHLTSGTQFNINSRPFNSLLVPTRGSGLYRAPSANSLL
jgi:hypothetical protein